jgi:hypothetical protein
MATIRRTLSNEGRVKITRFLSLHRGRTPCQFIEGDKRGSFSRSHHNRFLFARQKRPIDRDGLTINPLFFVLQGRNLLLYPLQSDPNVFASARWFAIPVAPELLRKTILSAILPTAKPFTVAATMLKQKNSASQFTNPGHLLKRCHRIWEGACGKGRD